MRDAYRDEKGRGLPSIVHLDKACMGGECLKTRFFTS